ncbi:MAG: hypothetical protein IMZ73_04900 [Chloroflexi bacterium]|nr:hypothetical protein [Chloroflexota bacterium]
MPGKDDGGGSPRPPGETSPAGNILCCPLNIIRLGREICAARKPACQRCPLRELCNYAKLPENQSDV